jgi:hypothetical protein
MRCKAMLLFSKPGSMAFKQARIADAQHLDDEGRLGSKSEVAMAILSLRADFTRSLSGLATLLFHHPYFSIT